MKKHILIAVMVLVLMMMTVTVVSANNGPHGGYTATTDACAGCHRAHTASGAQLLISSSTEALCLSCHGNTATGAVTNVIDGVLETAAGNNTGTPLIGGGFTFYEGITTTSTHDPTGTITDAWGNGVNRAVLASLADGDKLDCASCHDPHGSANYRIIRETINGKTVTVDQVDEGAWVYDNEDWPANMSNVCGACHSAYHVTRPGSGHDNSDDGLGNPDYGGDITTFAHRIDMSYAYGGNANPETTGFLGYKLPLADVDAVLQNDLVVCSTCHLSHGSSAAMSGYADGGGVPGGTSATDSALLRLDNRGVCEVCHQK